MSQDALLRELAGNRFLYCQEVETEGRRWFTLRILARVRAASTGAGERDAALRLIQTAKTRARECARAMVPASLDASSAIQRTILAVNAAYGMMGLYPAVFLERDEPDFLRFIVRRRVGAVERMRDEVNDDDGFIYPENLRLQHPNADSFTPVPLWRGVVASPANPFGYYPYELTTEGARDPAHALQTLFERVPNLPRDGRTAVDCASAAMIVLETALLDAAARPAGLGPTLASEGSRYLAIDHPHGSAWVGNGGLDQGLGPLLLEPAGPGTNLEVRVAFAWASPGVPFQALLVDPAGMEVVQVTGNTRDALGFTGRLIVAQLSRAFARGARLVAGPGRPEYHVVTDQRQDRALFEQGLVPEADLQIGDHVYLANHPVHREYLNEVSPWGGEHSLIAGPPTGRRETLRITGHGLTEATVREAVDRYLVRDLNRFLDLCRAVLRRHLEVAPTATPVWSGTLQQLSPAGEWEAVMRFRMGVPSMTPVTGQAMVQEWVLVQPPVDGEPARLGTWQTLVFDVQAGLARVQPSDLVYFREASATRVANEWPLAKPPTGAVPLERNPLADPHRPAVPADYGLSYLDDLVGRTRAFFPLYVASGPRQDGAHRVGYRDLRDAVLLSGRPGEVVVSRPRVVTDAVQLTAYLAALRRMVALPGGP